MRTVLLITIIMLVLPAQLHAELISLDIQRRTPFAEGKSFGKVGPYEIIAGVAHFAVDPTHKRNRQIVDLTLAPRTKNGRVTCSADFFILAPKDPHRGNGTIFYDVNNRGRKLALYMFNDSPRSNNPTTAAHAGNGYLLRRGYTIVWCGWIGELLPGNDHLLMKAPIAQRNGQPIHGIVRYEMVTDTPAETLPLSRREGHGSYPPTLRGEVTGTLTWRMRETDKRVPIPNGQWSVEHKKVPPVKTGVSGTLGQVRLRLAGGFRPGYIYELVCEAEGPIIQGLGFAVTRDLISFLRYDRSKRNPFVRSKNSAPMQRAYGFGVSQSGRFLRHLVYEGFNVDEQNRRVFDGLIPHVAGGGLGFFNHRFAQATRHNGQHEEHLYPADVFPFTYGISTDPFTKRKTGILHRLAQEDRKFLPKIMHTQSEAEYWHRAGSLVHTDPLGKRDVEIPDNVRIYAFGGTQHGPAAHPPTRGTAGNLRNPGDYRPLLRALLDALDVWVREDKNPPPSVYPRIDKKTLVEWHQRSTGFPRIPGVRYPEVIQRPPFAYFGPQFLSKKIITIEPPQVRGHYRVLVPQSDASGNVLGTLLIPDVAVPVATYTGWNLRSRTVGAEAMLASLQGSYIPFAPTRAARKRSGDPRLSVQERYKSFANYTRVYRDECTRLQTHRYLLAEDVQTLLTKLPTRRKLFVAR